MTASPVTARYREYPETLIDAFYEAGYRRADFFPHRTYSIPSCGPDAFRLAQRMYDLADPDKHWEIILYGIRPAIDEFPPDLFFDDDLVWHQQQYGRPAQIASVNIVVQDNAAYSTAHVSDVVQRISRFRRHKTRIEKVFRGWHYLLLHSLLVFARNRKVDWIYTPSAALAMENTDPKRTIKPELYERVYDRSVQRLFDPARHGRQWKIDVAKNLTRCVAVPVQTESIPSPRTICICHDIEEGHGHRDVDPALAASADADAERRIHDMIAIEDRQNVRATYQVVGNILEKYRPLLGHHCLAFHSYNHVISEDQLQRCRSVDYRLKGYRPPRSRITPELTAANLCHYNYEWLASSVISLGLQQPAHRQRVTRIPVHIDDFPMCRHDQTFADWMEKVCAIVHGNHIAVICLHDCYAPFWLSNYTVFLKEIAELATFKTLDEIAADMCFSGSV